MFVNLTGVKSGAPEDEPVCEECSQTRNLIHCIDASIQVDLSDAEEGFTDVDNAMGRKGESRRSAIPMYSREDIREQYCINDKELQVLDSKRRKGILGCFSDNTDKGLSPCTRQGKRSILTSCIGKSGSEDDLSGAGQNGRRPVSPGPGKNGSTWTGRGTGHVKDEDDGFDDNYFRRRPKSFYFEGRRLCPPDAGDLRLGDENHIRSMLLGYPVAPHQGPKPMGGLGVQYPGYSPALTRPEMFVSQDTLTSLHSVHTTQPNTPDLLLHRKAVNDSEVSLDDRKQKHVSFDSSSILRSQTVAGNMSHEPPSPSKSSERLLDGRKTPDYVLYSELFTPELARQIVLDRLKRSSMRTQATQTDVKRNPPAASPAALMTLSKPTLPTNNKDKIAMSPIVQRKTWIASSECAVQTNGLYSPPGQGPGPGHGLTHPPAAWFSSLHRPHYRNGDLSKGGFQVEVYDLDQPLARKTNFSPPRTSTLQEGLSGSGHDVIVMNQQTEENQNHSQQFNVRSLNSNSNGILDAEIGNGDQSSQSESEVSAMTPITSDDNFRRSRLVKSASSDGILGNKQNSGTAPDYLIPRRNSQDLCLSTESLESGLPELALVVGPQLPGDAADQNAFQSKGANATLKSCEKEIWLTSPQIKVPEKFNDPEAQQQEMNKNIQGYNSSICSEIETQQVSAQSFSSRKESQERRHIRDSKTSTSSSNSCDNTSVKSQASFDGDCIPINPDFDLTGDFLNSVDGNSRSSPNEDLQSKSCHRVLEQDASFKSSLKLSRSSSVKLEKKTEAALIRTTSSLPDGLTLSSSSLYSKEHLGDDTNDDQASSPSICRSSPTVPCLRPSSICSSHYASPTESRSVAVIVNMSELSEPEEVKSPVVSEAEEVSSSSGSYSVTSVTTDISKKTEEECTHVTSSETTQDPSTDLKINKISEDKCKADVIICDGMVVNTNAQETWEASPAIQTQWLHNTSNQSQHDQWSEIEKTQKRLCLKLNLSKEAINEKNNLEQPTENKCSESEHSSVTIVQQERKNSLNGNKCRISKTSPSLARSPAMHEGFRDKDWRVERTPINTPDSVKTLTSMVPQLSDEEEADETDSVASDSDPISKGSGTSSFLPSSVEVSDSRTGSLQDKLLTDSARDHRVTRSKPRGSLSETTQEVEDNEVQDPESKPLHSDVPNEESNIVLPPAGFTDSPVRNLPPACSADIDGSLGSVSKVFGTTENEILIVKTPQEGEQKSSVREQRQLEDFELSGVVTKSNNFESNESYHHPELVVCQRQELPEVMKDGAEQERNRNDSSSISGTGSRSRIKGRQKSRSCSRSKSSERLLLSDNNDFEELSGCYFGEYQKQAWVFVGEITSSISKKEIESDCSHSLKRSASIESTQSEKEFSKKYQAITHRMVHRKSSAIMYSRILERTFECNKTVTVQRVDGEFGFRIHGSRPVVVSAIEPCTPAESSGLTVGDILLTINGTNVLDLPHSQVVRVAQRCTEALELGVARTDDVAERPSVWEQLDMAQEVMAQGYLLKKKRATGGQGHHWVTRWFVLRADDCLYSFKSENDTRPSGAVLLPGCVVREVEDGEAPGAKSRLCLQVSRPGLDSGASSIWLAAEVAAEFSEWKEMLAIAANKRRSQDDVWLEVSRQRSSLPASAHASPDCRGHLHQFTGGSWLRQLLVLVDGCLYIYSDIEPDAPAIGVIYLHGYKSQPSSVAGRRHAWEMIPSEKSLRHFHFHAQTETEKKRWLAALEYSIDRWMRLS